MASKKKLEAPAPEVIEAEVLPPVPQEMLQAERTTVVGLQQQPWGAQVTKAYNNVMARLRATRKAGHNQRFGYDYVKEDDLQPLLREALIAEQCSFVAVCALSQDLREVETKNGKGMLLTLLKRFRFTHGPSGEYFEVEFFGMGFDSPGDKAAPKAETAVEKYAILKTFHVGTGGADPEEDDVQRPVPSQQRATGAATANTTPSTVVRMPQRKASPEEPVSEDQLKRFWTIARANHDDEAIKAELQQRGYASSKDIKRGDYDALCQWAEGRPAAA